MATIGARDTKKSDDQKSRPFRFRLHPESSDTSEVALHRELTALMNGRGSIRQYLIDLYRKAEKMPDKSKAAPVIDTRKIMTKLDKLMSYLKGLPLSGGHNAPAELPDYDDDFLSSLDRMLDAGKSADDDGPIYYSDED